MEYRNYNIVNDQNSPLKRIEAIGRGSVHLSLRGYYTSLKDAKKAIDSFILMREVSNA